MMSIDAARAIAVSGLTLQERRLAVSANNVANVNTDGFEAQRVEPETVRDGGVTSRIAPTGDPAPVVVNESGELETLSNTDLIQERVNQIEAQHAFAANVAVLQTADEMEASLLDLEI
jgi:flagellar basal-body rod protein FlgC